MNNNNFLFCSLLGICHIGQIQANAAIDGAYCADSIKLYMSKGLDEDTTAIVEIVETFGGMVVVVNTSVMIGHFYIHGTGIGFAITGLAVSHNGCNTEP